MRTEGLSLRTMFRDPMLKFPLERLPMGAAAVVGQGETFYRFINLPIDLML